LFQTIASANATSPRPSCRRLGCAALRSSSCCVASAFPSSTRCVPTASASPRYLAIAAHGVYTRSCECVLHTSESSRWSLLLCVCVVRLPHCVSDSVAPRTTQDILRRRSDCYVVRFLTLSPLEKNWWESFGRLEVWHCSPLVSLPLLAPLGLRKCILEQEMLKLACRLRPRWHS